MTNSFRPRGGHAEPVFIVGNEDVGLASQIYQDAFGRIRISEPQTLFETTHVLSSNPLLWETLLTGNGTATHVPARACMDLTVTGVSGDKVIRQTHEYIRYQPGKSQQILLTFVMSAVTNGVRQRVGYFDANNGIFLEYNNTGLYLTRRTNTSGGVVDTSVWYGYWNLDTLDGNGPSGITLDITKAQILLIDLEWLGTGRVRIGFIIGGKLYYVHEFLNANILTTVYMATAHLPVRYEIENTAAGSAATMQQICVSVNSEGGRQEQNLTFSRAMLAGRAVANADLPVLSIRVATVFPAGGSIVNRETVKPDIVSIFTEDAAIRWLLVYNGTLTDPVWVSVDTTHSGVQYDESATAITGGVVIDSGYAIATASARAIVPTSIRSDLVLALNALGTVGDVLSVVCQRLTAVSSDTWVSMSWAELY
jgi:hypothetical protein